MSSTFPSGLIGDVVSFNYRRRLSGTRESWHELCVRTIDGIAKLGKFTDEEKALVFKLQKELKTLTSGRWLWVGGTEWIERPENFAGAYNCQSSNMIDWAAFGYAMNFAMMGTGTGGVLEDKYISQLPVIRNQLTVKVIGEIGAVAKQDRQEDTLFIADDEGLAHITITVGDSRKGWVTAYQAMLELSTADTLWKHLDVTVDISNVRPNGEKLKGFGGTANPALLADLFSKLANILNKAIGRKLTSVECCLIMDEAAKVVVAGNIRRSAGMRQGDSSDELFGGAKENLWQCIDGAWKIDPERDALRMANHTRVFHQKPSQAEVLSSVRKQYHSGEGAIQWAGEAIARSNADLLDNQYKKDAFFFHYSQSSESAKRFLSSLNPAMDDKELDHRMSRYGLNPCLTGDTLVLTSKGAERIRDLVGKTVTIFDGQNWVEIDNFRVTGRRQEVFKVALASGDSIKATPYHTFILEDGTRKPLNELQVGEKLKDAFTVGEDASADLLMSVIEQNLEKAFFVNKSDYGYIAVPTAPRVKIDNPNRDFTVTSIEYYDNVAEVYCCTVPTTNSFALANGVLTGNCGEILGSDFKCNLSEIHLNRLDPHNHKEQDEAFRAATLSVCALLNHNLSALGDRFAYSREIDPIIGVSFTGLFDFFVNLFGRDWLDWWAAGRPAEWNLVTSESDFKFESEYFKHIEALYLKQWRKIVEKTAKEYCDRHGLKLPNRCTTVQPAGCLTVDAVRVSDNGLFYLDELMDQGIGDVLFSEIAVRDGLTSNSGISNSERHDLIKITTSHGRQITATPCHRFSVNGEWVRADQLTNGMTLDSEVGQYSNAVELPLEYLVTPETIGRGRQPKSCRMPEYMSPDLAYFIGAIYGNGCFSSHYRIRLSHGRKDVLLRLRDIGVRLFGLSGVLHEDPRGGRFELCFANKQLFEWFKLNGIDKGTKSINLDRIPVSIRMSSRDSILGFFAGLIDTDGCIRSNGTLSIDMACEAFIRNAQQIGEAVGLVFGVYHNTQGENLQETKNMWGLSLSKCASSPDSIDRLNQLSLKALGRPLKVSSRTNGKKLFVVTSIERNQTGYTYDITINTDDDNEAWYWQGAIKSHNSKSLITGASAGWHPSYAPYFIRRVTKAVNDPVALAAIALGYSVVPAQTDKDENGNLLTDPRDPRCTEWLIEIPYAMPWADVADGIDFNFSALAQFDFYMQVQQHYTRHNTSATISLRESEIEPLANAIYESIQNDTGYISAALLARFDENQTFPRLPFEAIDKATYERLSSDVKERATMTDFDEALALFDNGKEYSPEVKACEGVKCELGSAIDEAKQAGRGFEVELV